MFVGLLMQAGDQDRLEELHDLLHPTLPIIRDEVTAADIDLAGGDVVYA